MLGRAVPVCQGRALSNLITRSTGCFRGYSSEKVDLGARNKAQSIRRQKALKPLDQAGDAEEKATQPGELDKTKPAEDGKLSRTLRVGFTWLTKDPSLVVS